jgi:hypothetical protein
MPTLPVSGLNLHIWLLKYPVVFWLKSISCTIKPLHVVAEFPFLGENMRFLHGFPRKSMNFPCFSSVNPRISDVSPVVSGSSGALHDCTVAAGGTGTQDLEHWDFPHSKLGKPLF